MLQIVNNGNHAVTIAERQDSFHGNYFLNLSTTASDNVKKAISLSGDIELNPSPETNNSTSLEIITNGRSNALFNY